MSYPDRNNLNSDFTISNSNLIFKPVATAGQLTATDSAIAGTLNGTYAYMVTFVDSDGGETNALSISNSVAVVNKKVDLTNIPVSSNVNVVARRIYRKPASASADVQPLYLVTEIANNTETTYQDNLDDATLITNALANRINTTGGLFYSNNDIIMSLDSNTVRIGYNAMTLSTGYACTAVGVSALTANTSGNRNVAVGQYSLTSNTSGKENTSVGVHASNDSTTATAICSFGYGALKINTASSNTAFGHFSLTANITGSLCTAVGKDALKNSTANYNTGVGYNAGGSITSGANNTFLGRDAGAFLTDGTTTATGLAQGCFIGSQTKALSISDNNSIVIGYGAIGLGSNTCIIGNSSITKTQLQGDIVLNKTITAVGTTGAQTINKPMGSVNFAGAATSLVVTNSLVTTSSVIQATLGTNDATAVLGACVTAAGSFTIFMKTAPTAETKVFFNVFN